MSSEFRNAVSAAILPAQSAIFRRGRVLKFLFGFRLTFPRSARFKVPRITLSRRCRTVAPVRFALCVTFGWISGRGELGGNKGRFGNRSRGFAVSHRSFCSNGWQVVIGAIARLANKMETLRDACVCVLMWWLAATLTFDNFLID